MGSRLRRPVFASARPGNYRVAGRWSRAPPLGAVVALAVVPAVAATAVAMSLMLVAIPPKQLPAPLPEQNQDAETLRYLLAFAVLLPAALAVAPRLAAAIGAGDRLRAGRRSCVVVGSLLAILGLQG